jgi:hypothetical protein
MFSHKFKAIPPHLYFRLLNRFHQKGLWHRYVKLSCDFLNNSSAFVLSFDCDTDQDAQVVWDVHSRLMDMGILPVYAVPGELLIRGEKVYQKIFKTGAEFINHGGREHTYYDTLKKRHSSCFFYDQQTQDTLREDIILGHTTLQNVLGITANGFRAPHFGTFQGKDHLSFLYGVLRELNYLFSSSTIPLKGYQRGPIYQDRGIYEIPVTGAFSEPMNILDTWGYFEAPDRQKSPEAYKDECTALAAFCTQNPLIINIYGDPSHIFNEPLFFESMKLIAQSMRNSNLSELI